jgi:hypothetical protein
MNGDTSHGLNDGMTRSSHSSLGRKHWGLWPLVGNVPTRAVFWGDPNLNDECDFRSFLTNQFDECGDWHLRHGRRNSPYRYSVRRDATGTVGEAMSFNVFSLPECAGKWQCHVKSYA